MLWEVAARTGAVSPQAFPPFSRVMESLWNLIVTGKILGILLPSLERMAWGYVLALLLGLAGGIVMGYFSAAYHLFEPLTEFLRPIPSPAYVPIAILFLGLGNEMKIWVIAFSSLFPILLSTTSGVRAVDVIQIDTARTFGARPGMILWKVVLPSASPQILTGMRVSLCDRFDYGRDQRDGGVCRRHRFFHSERAALIPGTRYVCRRDHAGHCGLCAKCSVFVVRGIFASMAF